jgi:uncharacterized OB-fold protein
MISPVKVWRKQKNIRDVLGKTGTMLTWTKIVTAGSDFKPYAPYYVALVELEDGKRIFGQLVDTDDTPPMGKKVQVTLRTVRQPTNEGVIAYGVKFKPV